MNNRAIASCLSVLLSLIIGTLSAQAEPPKEMITGPVIGFDLNAPGKRLAAELTALYEATPARCPDDQPAYKCSGVIIRGTRQNLPEGHESWEPYPRGRTLDSSFNFVRADLRVPRLPWRYSNGFIIAPPEALSVNCFYPIDAVSNDRVDGGCGPNKTHLNTYSLCETLLSNAVTVDRDNEEYQWTLEQMALLWAEWDQRFASDSARRRCAFKLNDAHAAQRFELALAVSAKVTPKADKPNDLKVQTWNPGYDPRLPIRAFFYTNDQGKPFAERDRARFQEATNIHLPILKLTLSAELDGKMRFEYMSP